MNDFGSQSIALVVDDNPESLGMVSAALETQGLTVLVAKDGHSAIQLTERVQPDVILMDAIMPELDGFETCRILKTGPNPTLAPIIFMTGLSDQEHVVKGLQAGGVDYITKPVVIEELLARMTTHVLNSRLLQSARQAIDASERLVLAFGKDGDLKWGSQKALEVKNAGNLDLETAAFKAWLRSCIAQPVSSIAPYESEQSTLQFIGYSDAQEILVKLVAKQSETNEETLRVAFGLTAREAEVLFWLTLGKTNRDISAILSLSARTVNKHLEQVFQKMGVDNRTSAAVLADRQLNLEHRD
ncbi:response regulator transcription factor [Cognatishimia activa]|uniref:Putative transcriptional regulatory protein TcrX n=1 Tax=Cognatishimia activa TaxID=1715691 RepID=A0A0N7MBZ0_9RHOB|nr:DNA-binding response regulator [Cognatishimia activa]MEE2944581.1 DNA-binding response regulator [Pseudomonadota bacterium]CUI76540.1 putative transcriptional regulatory protein TcrX [Cognatishimia activa]CUK26744.1 putative transcriptional regulatory protein TcrX [Cognatishimia activa]